MYIKERYIVVNERGDVIEMYEDGHNEDVVVSMYKFRIRLLELGLYDRINNYIVNSNDMRLKIFWDYSTEVSSDSDIVLELKNNNNISDEEFERIFI